MLKKIINLFIILAVISLLYIVREDFFALFHKSIDTLQGTVNDYTLNKEQVPEIKNKTSTKGKVATPGPLTVFNKDGTVTEDNNQALTIAGIISATNKERLAQNLLALRENKKLNLSASKKVDDMFAKQYFEHVSPSGVGVSDLGKSVGYEYITIGENLALGNFTDSNDVVAAWMASPGHRANILRSKYQEIGVSAKEGIYKGERVWIAVQHFGTPISACPIVDKSLKATIDAEKEEIKPIEARLNTLRAEIDSGEYKGQEYNNRVNEYNQLIPEYNSLVEKIRAQIETYNAQIAAFNACSQSA